MSEIIPGILEADWEKIESKLDSLKGLVKTVQIDIIDGDFIDEKTFLDPAPFVKYKDDFILEAHFIVDEPINYLDSFAQAGFKRFIGHIEKMSDQTAYVAKGEMLGEVGLAIDLNTSLDSLKVNLFDLDCITLMAVKAGLSGQAFDKEVLLKVNELVNKAKGDYFGKKLVIEIDGGMNRETMIVAKEAGVDRFIVNSALFRGDIKENYVNLQRVLLS